MDRMPLFDLPEDKDSPQSMPLAARMRPQTFAEFVGQEHLVAEGRVFRKCIEADQLPSMVFWGPPGSGKTTLAHIIANVSRAHFSSLSAVSAGVADLRRVIGEAKKRLKSPGQRTILFVDEIHRFNKAQQDAVLPFVENGTVTFIGATTENPSFEVISPLLSRCRVFRLDLLSDEDVRLIVERAIKDKERGLGKFQTNVGEEALRHLVTISDGDARVALNALEMAGFATLPDSDGSRSIDLSAIEEALQHRALLYDKSGDQHYDLISALHKSLRGSDPDAGLYWLGRMLEAGEDPLYIARRLMRFASEDVGMADPQALVIAVAAQQAVHFVGLPEGNLALAEAVVYLAAAPKSNSLYQAYSRVQKDIQQGRNEPVPLHLRNPVTGLMRQMGYGRGYKLAHDYPDHFVKQQNLPSSLQGKRYYVPTEQGHEKEIADRLRKWWGQSDKGA
ncbi:MAG: replication-associated recombination protein A [Dehalococcoidia bacterium]|nr:replication-associated recombination protein A [Dehalococcoidia bacterium]MDH4367968.1 replication-associated recombination protein A [Dehalococcoidia bacterium]